MQAAAAAVQAAKGMGKGQKEARGPKWPVEGKYRTELNSNSS